MYFLYRIIDSIYQYTIYINHDHRQIIHDESKKGINKAISAVERLKMINSTLTCKAFTEKLTSINAIEIIMNYDLIIDATDNIGISLTIITLLYCTFSTLIYMITFIS